MMHTTKKSMAALLCAAMAAGCSSQAANPSQSASTRSLQSQAPAESEASSTQSSQVVTTPASNVNAITELDHLFAFSWDLFNNTRDENDNSILSPFSAWMALGMMANGTGGETRKQMEDVFGLSIEQINGLASSALKATSADEAHTLRLADSVWIRASESDSILDSYKNLLAADYQAESFETDFDDSTKQQINDWVREHTDGLIDQMPVDLSPTTMMILLNALSFDSAWQNEYEDDQIVEEMFHNQNGSEASVQMMKSDETQYISSQGLHGFTKLYKGYHYGLTVLIPEGDQSLDEVLHKVEGVKLLQDLKNPTYSIVHASFPEFTLSSEQGLIKPLQKMGLSLPFGNEADFSNLSQETGLHVSEIKQKAKIEVSRTGTKAAAATDIGVAGAALTEEEYTITCDRPFLYILSEIETGTPIFVGTVENISDEVTES
ncbi:serpin family protein [Erysipelotrichaceae bacterium 51-3]